MRLYLSARSPLNSLYRNEDGQVMYKVETPPAVGTRVSSISCVVPTGIPRRTSASASTSTSTSTRARMEDEGESEGEGEGEREGESGGEVYGNERGSVDENKAGSGSSVEVDVVEEEEADMRDRFARLAQIEHNRAMSSILRFGGQEIATRKYFRKEGFGVYGRHRVFTGPDGREYKWLLNMYTSKLIHKDPITKTEVPVAKYHPRTIGGVIWKSRPGSLEIFPAGEHMVDTILITFVYIERLRKEKERAARSP